MVNSITAELHGKETKVFSTPQGHVVADAVCIKCGQHSKSFGSPMEKCKIMWPSFQVSLTERLKQLERYIEEVDRIRWMILE